MTDLTLVHRRLLVLVGALFVATLIGMILLWPSASDLPQPDAPIDDVVSAEIRVFDVVDGGTDPVTGRPGDFAIVTLRIAEGPDAGQPVTLEVYLDGYPEFRVGDKVSLARADFGDGEVEYYITDFQRMPVLTILLGIFVAAVLIISRWHGLRALIGLAASLMIVVSFVVPAILAGQSPPIVAWVGAMAVMIITLYLTHGFNEMTTSAVVGTAAALTLTISIGLIFVNQARITGFASDDAVFARFAVEGLDLQGLVLAGLIIASLGVLDDVTVSQASTVFALHDTDRRLSWAALFARAMKVGRDHIASVVNTLFLAYAGASLALLVLFSTSGLPVVEIINSEILAEEIVKTVVGSLGLIAAVPFTTALAAAVAVRRSAAARTTSYAAVHPTSATGARRMRDPHVDDASFRIDDAEPPVDTVPGLPPGMIVPSPPPPHGGDPLGPDGPHPPSASLPAERAKADRQRPRDADDRGTEKSADSSGDGSVDDVDSDDLLWPTGDEAPPPRNYRTWIDDLGGGSMDEDRQAQKPPATPRRDEDDDPDGRDAGPADGGHR
ncbi:MAG: YibE/F family protein [Nitriliruptoraceae bacterium]